MSWLGHGKWFLFPFCLLSRIFLPCSFVLAGLPNHTMPQGHCCSLSSRSMLCRSGQYLGHVEDIVFISEAELDLGSVAQPHADDYCWPSAALQSCWSSAQTALEELHPHRALWWTTQISPCLLPSFLFIYLCADGKSLTQIGTPQILFLWKASAALKTFSSIWSALQAFAVHFISHFSSHCLSIVSSLLGSLFVIWHESVLRVQQTLTVLCELGHLAFRPLGGTAGYSELSCIILVVHVLSQRCHCVLALTIAFIWEVSLLMPCILAAMCRWFLESHGVVVLPVLFSRYLLLAIAGEERLKQSCKGCGAITWAHLADKDTECQTAGLRED